MGLGCEISKLSEGFGCEIFGIAIKTVSCLLKRDRMQDSPHRCFWRLLVNFSTRNMRRLGVILSELVEVWGSQRDLLNVSVFGIGWNWCSRWKMLTNLADLQRDCWSFTRRIPRGGQRQEVFGCKVMILGEVRGSWWKNDNRSTFPVRVGR